MSSLFQDFFFSLTKHKTFRVFTHPFSPLALLLLYTPTYSLSSSCHRLGAFWFCFSPHNFLVSLSFFLLLFNVVLVWASTIKVKNDDYYGVFFVVNQDYLNFSCNPKFSCSYSGIVWNGVQITIIFLVLSIKGTIR